MIVYNYVSILAPINVQGGYRYVIKSVSFEKLTGTALGNYYLERYIGQSKIGATFLARNDSSTTYLLRFLDRSMNGTSREGEEYLEHFQYRARQIATLQHPYILPLLDFGVYRGYPYLISPNIPLRSLRTRVVKNGRLDTFTVGRYLDQVATALEYAHEHVVLHGSLSVDSIFIRLDGNLAVADFGVKSLLEQDVLRNQSHEWSEGVAPEQLLGKPATPASDVYALGMVSYYLLTGAAVFVGSTAEEVAQQHLYASIPPLNQLRSDLPPSLYSVLARALAKDPTQRFNQAGVFANAYHRSVMTTNRTRVPFVASEMFSAQPYQPPDAGAPMTDMTDHAPGSPRATLQSRIPHSLHGFPEDEPLRMVDTPRPALMRRLGSKRRQPIALIAALLVLLVIASSTIGIALLRQGGAAVSNARGQVTFFAGQNDPGGQTNSLNISVQNLAAPPAGYEYQAWIIDDQTEQVTLLGTLTQKGQTWVLTSSGGNGNLLAAGDKLEVTKEQGEVSAPAGQVVLSGTFPVKSFAHIQHLLVSYPETPSKIGFLVGVLGQAHLLDNQAAVLQSVAASKDTGAVVCVAQSMLDIIDGTQGTHYQRLASACTQQHVSATGDGFGLLGKSGYLADSAEHAAFALSQPDATSVMRQHAALMDIGLNNIKGWLTTVEQDLLLLHAHPGDLSSLQQITSLADDAYHGVDANGDGQIDAVPGEAGAITAYLQGQLMATLTLSPSA